MDFHDLRFLDLEVSQSVDFWKGEYLKGKSWRRLGVLRENDAILLVGQSFGEAVVEMVLEG